MIEWSQDTIDAFRQTLLDWYDTHGRDLPWRQDHDPYHVWISEIMLQQTQVNTVIPYYERFMTWFPTVQELATAPEARLMKAWEGLGYYSRARNLQKAARQIVADYHGQWPQTADGLRELAGIGPYTAGAIASIAFDQPVPAVDGNAFRVFARLLKIDADIAKPQTRQIFEQVITRIISPDRPGDFNQAIMDLGASYMSAKNPDSEHSPVRQFNQAYLDGVEDQYPVKTKKPRPKPVAYLGLVMPDADQYLMEKRPSNGLLANFWTFPLVKQADVLVATDSGDTDSGDNEPTDSEILELLRQYLMTKYGFKVSLKPVQGRPVTHTFTHQKWTITLLQVIWNERPDLSYFPGEWLNVTKFDQIAWPKVQEKMWARVGK